MDNEIGAILDEYRRRREENLRVENARKQEVFAACPGIEQLCGARFRLITDGLRSILKGGGTDVTAQMEDYNRRIREALRENGYPEDYLEPVYRCPICRDTGYVGEPVREKCACLKKALASRRLAGAGDASFETADADFYPDVPLPGQPITQRRYMRTVMEKCRQFADSYPDGPRKNLLLHGASGLGKTFLLRCIANRLSERGVEAIPVTAFRLLNDLRDEYFRPGSADTQPYFTCALLLIDDLGMEPLFDNITVEVFFHVLNERTARGLGTVVSTNLSRTELKERYTERFTSRLLDHRIALDIPLLGSDVRMQ